MDLNEFKEEIRASLLHDLAVSEVRTTGATLKEALRLASGELDLPLKRIQFDVIQKGSKGVLGIGKKEWVIVAYPGGEEAKQSEGEGNVAADGLIDAETGSPVDQDGIAIVKCINENVTLCVRPPKGSGAPATYEQVVEKLAKRGVGAFDEPAVKRALKLKENKEIKIGTFVYNPLSDGTLWMEISTDEMEASVGIRHPKAGGRDFIYTEIYQFILSYDIKFGIQKEVIRELAENPVYDKLFVIARGEKAKHGANGYVEYKFDTNKDKAVFNEDDIRINFKAAFNIANVKEGDVLAVYHEPTKGIEGHTVHNRILKAYDGKETQIQIGENVQLSEDKKQAVSLIDGQALLQDGVVSVLPVYYVNGSLSIKTGGNIDFIGSVVINGDVEDGYVVKASKGIQIHGSIGKSEVVSGGDIVVSNGIQTKGEGVVRAGGSVISKFIGNSIVFAEDRVVVSDGIVNSQVNCGGKIICYGKRARIHGGQLRAANSIIAKEIGTAAGTETVLEVGVNPESRERFNFLDNKIKENSKQIENYDLNIATFEKTIKTKGALTEERKAVYEDMKTQRDALLEENRVMTDEFIALREEIQSAKGSGEISVENIVYPNVKININTAEYTVRNELKWVTFFREGPMIKMREYSVNKEDLK